MVESVTKILDDERVNVNTLSVALNDFKLLHNIELNVLWLYCRRHICSSLLSLATRPYRSNDSIIIGIISTIIELLWGSLLGKFIQKGRLESSFFESFNGASTRFPIKAVHTNRLVFTSRESIISPLFLTLWAGVVLDYSGCFWLGFYANIS